MLFILSFLFALFYQSLACIVSSPAGLWTLRHSALICSIRPPAHHVHPSPVLLLHVLFLSPTCWKFADHLTSLSTIAFDRFWPTCVPTVHGPRPTLSPLPSSPSGHLLRCSVAPFYSPFLSIFLSVSWPFWISVECFFFWHHLSYRFLFFRCSLITSALHYFSILLCFAHGISYFLFSLLFRPSLVTSCFIFFVFFSPFFTVIPRPFFPCSHVSTLHAPGLSAAFGRASVMPLFFSTTLLSVTPSYRFCDAHSCYVLWLSAHLQGLYSTIPRIRYLFFDSSLRATTVSPAHFLLLL